MHKMESSCKSPDFFDFKEEDEIAEVADARLARKFQSSDGIDKCTTKTSNAIDKYTFLEQVSQGINIQSTQSGSIRCVDLDSIDSDRNGDSAVLHNSVGAGEFCASKRMSEVDAVPPFNSSRPENTAQFRLDKTRTIDSFSGREDDSSSGAASACNSHLDCTPQESLCSDEFVDVTSDTYERMSERFPSTSSDTAEDKYGASADQCLGVWDMGDAMAVIFHPDYIVYRNKYCTDSVLCFSSSNIKINGATAYGNQGAFSFQCAVDDIIDIESQWFGRCKTAVVKIRVISKDVLQAEIAGGSASIEVLEFAVADLDWYKKQEVITSLHGYNARWNVVLDTDVDRNGEALLGQNNRFLTLRYFPNFGESFEDVIYPKGDADAVSISKRDIDLLQPDTFVNDTIIDFYIKYLKNKIPPEDSDRFYFFNSFFFRKLADLDKNPSSAFEGRAAFQRVRKWTRKVKLFEKDYVFIPVNFNFHWSLIIICYPCELTKFPEDVEMSLRVPCILHMDSIRGSHTGLKGLMQSYLWEEWKERQKEPFENISSRFLNLRFISLELPQQQNSFDCGLFLLHYVECFLDEVPKNFSPFNITKFSNFLNVDWFLPEEASLKRVHIQKLIYNLLENRSLEISSVPDNKGHCSSDCLDNNNETAVEFLSEGFSTSKVCHGTLQADQGIEMTLLPGSSLRNSLCGSDTQLGEFFEAGVAAESFVDARYQTIDQTAPFHEFKNFMPPVEEDVAAGPQFAFRQATDSGLQRLSGITLESCGLSYSREFKGETSWNPGTLVHQEGHEDIDSSQETSISGSDDSFGVGVNENSPVRREIDFKEKIDLPRSPSAENIKCLTQCFSSAPTERLDVADFHYPGQMLNGNDAGPLASCSKSLPENSHNTDMQEHGNITCNEGDNLEPESDEQHVAKKMRIMTQLEGGMTPEKPA